MAVKQLEAKRRERVGKGAARAVRRENRVPAVIYGAGQPPMSISLDYNSTSKLVYAGRFLTTLFEIDVEGEKVRALPRDYQLDPVTDKPIHVDFLRLVAGAMVRVEVPVHFFNQETSVGLKKGGTLNIVRHTVEMMVPADNIPGNITGDLAKLDLGESLHISAFTIPEGCTLVISDRDFTVATIAVPSGYKEAEQEEAAAAAAGTEAAAPAAPAKK
jgi:large subunit ribosomal protein L25